MITRDRNQSYQRWDWRYVGVLSLYTLAALLLTWPLVRHFTTHVPGDGIDDPSLAWNLWWIKVRLVDQLNLDIFHVDWMFHPIQINLGFYTLTPLNGLLSVPLQTAFNLVTASNILLLSSFVLGGFGVYLLTLQELNHSQLTIRHCNDQATPSQPGRSCDCSLPSLGRVRAGLVVIRTLHLAALFAGFLYAFASAKLFYVALGQFNIASSQWIPFGALYTLRLARSTNWRDCRRNAMLAAIFLIFQAWAELTYASFLLIFILFAFLWSLWENHASRITHHASRFLAFTLFALIFVLGIAPFLWAMAPDLLSEGDFFASGGGFADQYSADLAGYLLPTQHHPLLGHWVQDLAFPHDKGQQIFIGYTALLLSVVGAVSLWRRTAARYWGSFWIAATLLFWWLTLGAQARWLGTALPIPGPFALISQLPFFSGNRYPSRYSVMLLLGVAVLAGAGLAWLLRQGTQDTRRETRDTRLGDTPRRSRISYLVSCFLLLLFLCEHLSIPLPLSDFRVPAIYQRLAAQPGDFTVLELPTGWRNGARVMGKSDILIMMEQWYQTQHGKRRLGGNTSRNPAYKFQYFTNAPLLGDLIALMNAEAGADLAKNEIARVVEGNFAEIVARNQVLAPTVLAFLDVQYVTVHVEQATPALLRFIDEALPLTLVDEWQGPDWRGTPSTIRLYRVAAVPSPVARSLDLAASSSSLYLAEGWSNLPWQGFRYSTRPCATLLLNLPSTSGQLTLHLAAAVDGLTFTLNGRTLTADIADAKSVNLALPAGIATEPIDRLTLCAPVPSPLTTVTASPTDGWPIGKSGVNSPVNIVVESAGNDVGNFAQILIDGKEIMQAQTGYNLAALDPTGALLATQTFDTFAGQAAADAMATWLGQWPVGTLIAGAVMDEASNSLTAAAVTALSQVGVTTDLRSRFRWSHAFVGLVGSAPGSALEMASLLQPATVAVGVPIAAPVVYVGVGALSYHAVD